jgi:hypothetical protein
MSGRHWLQFALLASAVGLAVLWNEVSVRPVAVRPAAPTARPVPVSEGAAPSVQPAAMANLQALGQTRDRPLFSATRRPAAATATAPAVASSTPPELLGTMVNADTERALLRTPDTPSPAWFGVGESASGWKIRTIAKDEVIVVSGTQTLHLHLYPTNGPVGQ